MCRCLRSLNASCLFFHFVHAFILINLFFFFVNSRANFPYRAQKSDGWPRQDCDFWLYCFRGTAAWYVLVERARRTRVTRQTHDFEQQFIKVRLDVCALISKLESKNLLASEIQSVTSARKVLVEKTIELVSKSRLTILSNYSLR